MSSAAEAETFRTFKNCKTDISMQTALMALDHKQIATPLKTDNSTTEGFVNLGMKPKRSKTWNINWHWLRYKEVLEQLRVYWENLNEQWHRLFYKTSPPNWPSSNSSLIYTYLELSEDNSSDHNIMWGCVEPSPGYSVLYRIHEGDTSKTTIYDREMSYIQTVKPSQTIHNVAH